jgi:hypothetical protein
VMTPKKTRSSLMMVKLSRLPVSMRTKMALGAVRKRAPSRRAVLRERKLYSLIIFRMMSLPSELCLRR